MANVIMDMLGNMVVKLGEYFKLLMDGTGMLSVWFMAVMIVLVMRALLGPVLGITHIDLSGSDKARRQGNGKKNRNRERSGKRSDVVNQKKQ